METLVEKTIRAAKDYQVKQVILAGGVAANSGLRSYLKKRLADAMPGLDLLIPPISLCGDNAAMIGAAGTIAYRKGDFGQLDLNAQPGLML